MDVCLGRSSVFSPSPELIMIWRRRHEFTRCSPERDGPDGHVPSLNRRNGVLDDFDFVFPSCSGDLKRESLRHFGPGLKLVSKLIRKQTEKECNRDYAEQQKRHRQRQAECRRYVLTRGGW